MHSVHKVDMLNLLNRQVLVGQPMTVRYYNPPSYSIGRHVFFSRNLSGLSGGAVISLTLVTIDVDFNSLC